MAIKRRKISVIGSGFTGATTALMLAQKELGDVVLVDIPEMEDSAKGKALDMLQAAPIQGFDAHIKGTANYEDTKDSDLVIITAGIARKPGMSRDDLVNTNAGIMKSSRSGVSAPATMFSSVDLPAPLEPITVTNSAGASRRLTSCSARRSFTVPAKNVLAIPVSSSISAHHPRRPVPRTGSGTATSVAAAAATTEGAAAR